jgi:membrane fusion protein, heavy metal efflux system
MNMYKLISTSIVFSLFFGGCGNTEVGRNIIEKEKFCLDERFRQQIEIIQPEKKQVVEGIPLTGSVESNPDKVIHFVSLVGGIISSTSFSLGDQVTRGQVLAELRSIELSELESQSKTIDAQINVTEKRLQSVQSMYDDGISSQRDLLEAQSDLAILKAERERISANLSLFSASPERGVFQIRSPTSGIVTDKSISAGMQISAEGEPLFTISDLSEVWVMVNIYASNIQNIVPGMDVEIKTLSYEDEVFNGEITAISHVFDKEAKVLKARVALPNKDLKLKPGMLVDVNALKQTNAEALSVPASALVFDENQYFVIVYEDDCNLFIRKVEILLESNGDTFLASGLNENEQIISKNQLLIYEQLKNF